MFTPLLRKILTDRPREEEYHYNRRRDPKGTVQVGVPLKHVKEVLTGVDCATAAVQDLVGVDIEELLVEGYAPEVAAGGGGGGAGAEVVVAGGLVEKGGGGVGGDFGAVTWVGETWRNEGR